MLFFRGYGKKKLPLFFILFFSFAQLLMETNKNKAKMYEREQGTTFIVKKKIQALVFVISVNKNERDNLLMTYKLKLFLF